jgi:hypothetical protein
MASCDYCNKTILFGGVRQNDLRFCGKACQLKAHSAVAAQFHPDDVEQLVNNIHQGKCPICNGDGPIDVQLSHEVWSAFFLTRWVTKSKIACQRCGNKARTKALLSSALLGWWGIPWGLLITPMQIIRNISGLSAGAPSAPSSKLKRIVMQRLGAQALQQSAAQLPATSQTPK